jgi:hypothetical protein
MQVGRAEAVSADADDDWFHALEGAFEGLLDAGLTGQFAVILDPD